MTDDARRDWPRGYENRIAAKETKVCEGTLSYFYSAPPITREQRSVVPVRKQHHYQRLDLSAGRVYIHLQHGPFRLNRFGEEIAKGFLLHASFVHQSASQPSGAPIPRKFTPK